mmetsp:Transcript_9551/g.58185  ORF Transcript_9551/g.58185 Transcript_9551/m.58185 type:complete len:100 (+) Transcript_9551:132-431(+)
MVEQTRTSQVAKRYRGGTGTGDGDWKKRQKQATGLYTSGSKLPSPRREDPIARIDGRCMERRRFGVEWLVLSNKMAEQANERRNAIRPQSVHRQSFGDQ